MLKSLIQRETLDSDSLDNQEVFYCYTLDNSLIVALKQRVEQSLTPLPHLHPPSFVNLFLYLY